MAVDQLPAPVREALASATPLRIAPTATAAWETLAWPLEQETKEWPRGLVRLVEVVPGALALFLISSLVWGYIWFPVPLAVGLLIFDAYWLWKSWTIGFHVVKGVHLIRRFQARDWRDEYAMAVAQRRAVLPWDGIRHVVIIPNYKESTAKLRDTLRVMAETDGAASSVIPVLAMEQADPDAPEIAAVLYEEFAGKFADFLVTHHPVGLPGEVRGKSSNQAWAARAAVEVLVGRRGLNLDLLTVTSCDADTLFPRQYFECLTFMFATDPKRYRRFWQAPIFFYNNIWQVPAPLRVPNALSGLIHLSRLSRRRRVLFSQSTYSLSMRMAHDVGYWDVDVIPEDWHMFLKCFYGLGGKVDVEPIYLPLGNDGALSRTTGATFLNQYLQVRRWAWGVVDIPYVLREATRRREIPLLRRYLRFWYVFENHISWSTQWFFITLGGLIPWVIGQIWAVRLVPDWFYVNNLVASTSLAGWHPAFLPAWLSTPGWVTLPTLILTPCLLFYVVLITVDASLRPPPPPSQRGLRRVSHFLFWLAISPITFFFSALPALDSQVRLMLGRRMEYRVTEKV